MTTQNAVQVDHLLLNRLMSHSSHQIAKTKHTATNPGILSAYSHLEVTLKVACTIEGKSKKLKGFWTFPSSFRSILLCKTTKLNELCLFWFKRKRKLIQTLGQHILKM